MSIFSLFLNQPQAVATTPPATPPATPPPPVQPAHPQNSPAAPVRSASSWTFSTDAAAGLVLRNFGNDREDPALGFAARICGGARYQGSGRVGFTAATCFTHESFDGTQDASANGIVGRLSLSYRAMDWLSLTGSVHLGASHLDATASPDGTRGLFYDNLPLAYSANNWGISAGASAGLNFRLLNSAAARIFLGAEYSLAYAHWDLVPDAIDRSERDGNIGVSSMGHQFMGVLTFALGPSAEPSLSAREAGVRPAPAPIAPQATPPVVSAPAPTPPVTPSSSTPAPVSAGTANYAETSSFSLAASARNVTSNGAIASGMDASRIDANLLPNSCAATFTLSYRNNRNGSLQLNGISRDNADGSRTNWHAPYTGAPVTAQQIHDLMEAIKGAGLPRHAATASGRPIHLSVNRDAQGRISLHSY